MGQKASVAAAATPAAAAINTTNRNAVVAATAPAAAPAVNTNRNAVVAAPAPAPAAANNRNAIAAATAAPLRAALDAIEQEPGLFSKDAAIVQSIMDVVQTSLRAILDIYGFPNVFIGQRDANGKLQISPPECAQIYAALNAERKYYTGTSNAFRFHLTRTDATTPEEQEARFQIIRALLQCPLVDVNMPSISSLYGIMSRPLTAVLRVQKQNNIEDRVIYELLNRPDIDVGTTTYHHGSPLYVAIGLGRVDYVRRMLDIAKAQGADALDMAVNMKDDPLEYEHTPLYKAALLAKKGEPNAAEILNLLLENGAEFDASELDSEAAAFVQKPIGEQQLRARTALPSNLIGRIGAFVSDGGRRRRGGRRKTARRRRGRRATRRASRA